MADLRVRIREKRGVFVVRGTRDGNVRLSAQVASRSEAEGLRDAFKAGGGSLSDADAKRFLSTEAKPDVVRKESRKMPKTGTKKYIAVTRPRRGKKLKRVAGTGTVSRTDGADKKLGIKKGDQVFVSSSKTAALKHVSRQVITNGDNIGAISRSETQPVKTFARAQSMPKTKRKPAARKQQGLLGRLVR